MVGKIEVETALRKGREEGRQDGIKEFLANLMSNKMGEIPSNIATRLNILTSKELQELGIALNNLHSYSDVETWIASHI